MQREAEQYLGALIYPTEWSRAKAYAERKLAFIIEREGDADGARREPWYLAQLIAETVRAERFSEYTRMLYERKQATGDKKRTAHAENVSHPYQQPYCSTDIARMQ